MAQRGITLYVIACEPALSRYLVRRPFLGSFFTY
jgi:hypothetical protein